MTTDKFYFYLQNRLIQTSQTGGQWYSDTPPLVFPGTVHHLALTSLDQLFFILKILFTFLTKQAILIRRSVPWPTLLNKGF